MLKRHGRIWWIHLHLDGHRIRRSAGRTATRAQAAELERRIISDFHADRAGRPPARTLSSAIIRWLDEYADTLKSRRQIEIRAARMLPHIQGRAVAEIGQVAQDVQTALLSENRSPATVNRYLADLRRVGRLCARWGWLETAPTVTLLREPAGREVYLTPEEVRRLADAAPTDACRTAILLLAMTGLRRGELLALTADDVRDGCVVVRESKAGRPRVVPVPDEALPLLDGLPLPVSGTRLGYQFRAAREAAGMERVRLHDLRHTYASWLVQAGVSLYAVQRLLGHSGPAMTQRYAHLETAELSAVAGELGVI